MARQPKKQKRPPRISGAIFLILGIDILGFDCKLDRIVNTQVFTDSRDFDFLLKELRENKSPFLLPSDLHNRIKGGVAENARQTPVIGRLKETGGEVGGEFVLFRKGAGGTMEALLKRKAERIERLEAMDCASGSDRRVRIRLRRVDRLGAG